MEHLELLRYLADTFDRLGLRYAVTGSTATITYGEPRFTNDIDVVVDIPAARIDEFMLAFPRPDFYPSLTAVESAVAHQRQFNIIHPTSGLKVDVIVASQSEFDRQRLDRSRLLAVLADRSVSFAAPEDVILKKMEYYQQGGSEKHLRDISGVLRLQGDRIDRDRITAWAARLGVSNVWSLVLSHMVVTEKFGPESDSIDPGANN